MIDFNGEPTMNIEGVTAYKVVPDTDGINDYYHIVGTTANGQRWITTKRTEGEARSFVEAASHPDFVQAVDTLGFDGEIVVQDKSTADALATYYLERHDVPVEVLAVADGWFVGWKH